MREQTPNTSSAPPDRLAVFGDVHGNLAALQGVLAAIDRAGITHGVVTGDVVMRGDAPAECLDLLSARGWPAVAGNTDRKVALRPPRPADHPASQRVGSRSWTARRLSDDQLRMLQTLPLTVTIAVGGFQVMVMHASPEDPTLTLVDGQTPAALLGALADRFGVDAVVSGHTHLPHLATAAGCLFLNPGSVGESLDDGRRPAWAWLEATPRGLVAHLERVDAPLARVRVPRSARR